MTAADYYDRQITWPWSRPFDETGVGYGTPGGVDTGFFPVAINGREYMVDWASGLYRRLSINLLRTRQNEQPNENLLLSPEVWRTVVESWHQGAGQTRRDRENSLPFRFYSSRNINPWNQWGIELLPATDKVLDLPGDALVASTNIGLAVVSGTTLSLYRDSFDFTPYVETLPAEAVAITADGESVYVALVGGEIVRYLLDLKIGTYQGLVDQFTDYTSVAALTAYSTLLNDVDPITPQAFCTAPGEVDLLTYMKGFLVASVGESLYDITTGVADLTTLIYTHPLNDVRWTAGTDGLSAGYLLGGKGDRWLVYSIIVRDDAATLDPPVVAAPLPEGEIGYSLGSYLGFVLIGTDRGVRFSTPGGDGTLTYGRLIETNSPVRSFQGRDRFVWFGIGGVLPDQENVLAQQEAGLARMDLSTFTAPLTPAYASDLTSDVLAPTTVVSTFNGRIVFVVPGHGIYAEADRLADEGWLEEGIITMGVPDAKTSLYSSFLCEPRPGTISLAAAADSRNYQTLISLETSSVVSSGNVYMESRRFSALLAKHTLTGDARMTRFETRAVPVVGAAHEWQVPLLLAESINLDNVQHSRDVGEDLQHLMRIVESGVVFQFREGDVTRLCFSPGYEWRPESQSNDEGHFRGLFILRVREIR